MNKMKHIARQFLNQVSSEELEKIKKNHPGEGFKRGKEGAKVNKKKITPYTVAYLTTTKGITIQGFPLSLNGKTYTFPEPNPTLIYFASAQRFRNEIDQVKPGMLPKLDPSSTNEGEFTHDVYNYYCAVCGTIIFLSTALEAFMNSLIKPNDVYVRKTKDKDVPLDFTQIQKSVPFNEKIKSTIPDLRKKDFLKENPKQAQLIYDVQDFRDSIIHTKTKNTVVKHDSIIKKSLTFKYDEAISAVADYMNFYLPGVIVECPCGADF